MKKEMFLAVLVGLLFGLIITYGVYRAQRPNTSQPQLTATPSASITSELNQQLVLHSPEDEVIQTSSAVRIAGTTIPNIFVVIFVNNEEIITTADQSGNFSVETELESGSNIIIVETIDEDGNTTEVERTVIYSTVPLEETVTDEATDSAEEAE